MSYELFGCLDDGLWAAAQSLLSYLRSTLRQIAYDVFCLVICAVR